MSDQVRYDAKVKWFNESKGFGFLIVDTFNRDVFVHRQQLTKSGLGDLVEDEAVTCVVKEGPKGLYAVDIKKAV